MNNLQQQKLSKSFSHQLVEIKALASTTVEIIKELQPISVIKLVSNLQQQKLSKSFSQSADQQLMRIYNSRNYQRALANFDRYSLEFIYNSRNYQRALASRSLTQTSCYLQQQKLSKSFSHLAEYLQIKISTTVEIIKELQPLWWTSKAKHLQQQKLSKSFSPTARQTEEVHLQQQKLSKSFSRQLACSQINYLQQQKLSKSFSPTATPECMPIYNSRNYQRALASDALALTLESTTVEIIKELQPHSYYQTDHHLQQQKLSKSFSHSVTPCIFT